MLFGIFHLLGLPADVAQPQVAESSQDELQLEAENA
jgi:hypothetical protein